MLTMRMTFEKSHLFLHTPHDKWLVDTGAPTSISVDTPLVLDMKDHVRSFEVPKSYMGLSIPMLTDLVGVDFNGLLGTDILNEYDIVWDIQTETMKLAEDAMDVGSLGLTGTDIEIGNIMGVPTLIATCGEAAKTMFFDTGAPYSYLTNFDEELPPEAEKVEDFLPGFGTFTTKLWQTDFKIGKAKHVLQTGELPTPIGMSLSLAGTEGIIGNEIMTRCRIGYFPRRNMMVFEQTDAAARVMPQTDALDVDVRSQNQIDTEIAVDDDDERATKQN